MKKIFSLLKASMSEGMNLFKINVKNKKSASNIILPILLAITLMGMLYSYSEMMIEQLEVVHMEFVVLTLFIVLTSMMTLIEGIYKSGNLLFNCKDDNLLFSMPISKKTVLLVRVFKFYLFELLYNSLFLLPAIVVYAIHMNPNMLYYLISFIGLLLFPIVPILISCVIGTFITYVASRFKGKNHIQTLLTVILLVGVFYFSFCSDQLVMNIAQNASNINDFITKLYYPARAYIELVTDFKPTILLTFILVHTGLMIFTIILIGRVYFHINSSMKSVKNRHSNKHYKIKTVTPMKAMIKKEFNRFMNSTVFITNAGFGLVLFLIGCILIVVKYNSFIEMLTSESSMISTQLIQSYMPVIILGLICFASFMTSITSSMISLEGKSFSILKSLPIRPYIIIQSKVLTAILIMIPCIVIGDIIIFIRFQFQLLTIFLLLMASIILPLLSETIGIIINLKYPKMDAKNDTEVVKQSMSSAISVLSGMILFGLTVFGLVKAIEANWSTNLILFVFLLGFILVYIELLIWLYKKCNYFFERITV